MPCPALRSAAPTAPALPRRRHPPWRAGQDDGQRGGGGGGGAAPEGRRPHARLRLGAAPRAAALGGGRRRAAPAGRALHLPALPGVAAAGPGAAAGRGAQAAAQVGAGGGCECAAGAAASTARGRRCCCLPRGALLLAPLGRVQPLPHLCPAYCPAQAGSRPRHCGRDEPAQVGRGPAQVRSCCGHQAARAPAAVPCQAAWPPAQQCVLRLLLLQGRCPSSRLLPLLPLPRSEMPPEGKVGGWCCGMHPGTGRRPCSQAPGRRSRRLSLRRRRGLLPTPALLPPAPPQVGVSPVCILGVNINAGQEISLRLRTDDLKGGLAAAAPARPAQPCAWHGRESSGLLAGSPLLLPPLCCCAAAPAAAAARRCRLLHACSATAAPPAPGFRRYDRIRETLLHELAHMVWVSEAAAALGGHACRGVGCGFGSAVQQWWGCLVRAIASPCQCRPSIQLNRGAGRPRRQLQAAEQPGGVQACDGSEVVVPRCSSWALQSEQPLLCCAPRQCTPRRLPPCFSLPCCSCAGSAMRTTGGERQRAAWQVGARICAA